MKNSNNYKFTIRKSVETLVISILFYLVVLFVAILYLIGETPYSPLFDTILFIVCVVLFSVAATCFLVSFFKWKIVVYSKSIVVHGTFGKTKNYCLSDVKRISVYYSLPNQKDTLIIRFFDDFIIRILSSYRGYEALLSFLKKRFPVERK